MLRFLFMLINQIIMLRFLFMLLGMRILFSFNLDLQILFTLIFSLLELINWLYCLVWNKSHLDYGLILWLVVIPGFLLAFILSSQVESINLDLDFFYLFLFINLMINISIYNDLQGNSYVAFFGNLLIILIFIYIS